MIYFFQGLTMGLAYVAPIGLQNLFVIDASLSKTRRQALVVAMVVIFFDVTLALACFFGIGKALELLPFLEPVVLGLGSMIVFIIGVGLLRGKAAERDTAAGASSLKKIIIGAFVVTWCNPQAVIDGTMMLGAFRVTLSALQQLPFILGVAGASCLWFTILTLILSFVGDRFSSRHLRVINIICGAVICCYALKLFWNFVLLLIR